MDNGHRWNTIAYLEHHVLRRANNTSDSSAFEKKYDWMKKSDREALQAYCTRRTYRRKHCSSKRRRHSPYSSSSYSSSHQRHRYKRKYKYRSRSHESHKRSQKRNRSISRSSYSSSCSFFFFFFFFLYPAFSKKSEGTSVVFGFPWCVVHDAWF